MKIQKPKVLNKKESVTSSDVDFYGGARGNCVASAGFSKNNKGCNDDDEIVDETGLQTGPIAAAAKVAAAAKAATKPAKGSRRYYQMLKEVQAMEEQ